MSDLADSEPPHINLLPSGFVNVATTEEKAAEMREDWKTQVSASISILFSHFLEMRILFDSSGRGVRTILLTPMELKQRFPFMNVDDVKLAAYGQFLFYS